MPFGRILFLTVCVVHELGVHAASGRHDMPVQGTDHGPPAVLVAVVPLRVARREASEVLLPTSLVVALVARIARLERAGVDKEERDVGVGEGEALFVDGVRDVL